MRTNMHKFCAHLLPRAVGLALAVVAMQAGGRCVAGPLPCAAAVSPIATGQASAFDSALERIARQSDNPARARQSLLLRVAAWPMCYPDNLSEEEWEAIFQATGFLNPAEGGGDGVQVRYYIQSQAWLGEGRTDTSGRAQPASLTYSFPDDGTTWGLSSSGFPTGPNTLDAELIAVFGDLDRGREHIRQALAGWRINTGVQYREVADNNSPMDHSTARNPARGDIRIGALDLNVGVLAYNSYPVGGGTGSLSGGDMCLNSYYFLSTYLANPGVDFRYLRNTITHEHGHGLGLRHSVPCNTTKIMEPQVGAQITGLQIDDIRGGQRNNGDRFAGNNSSADALPLGELGSPAAVSILVPSVSTNGAAGYDFSHTDWYTFTLGASRSVSITAEPFGGFYTTAEQDSGCTGSPLDDVNAQAAGNHKIELRRPASTLLQSSNTSAAGLPETLNAGVLPAGTYFVSIRDILPDEPDNQRVQLYNLKIRVDSASFPPLAVAGVSKRVRAGTDCWLMGHLHSRALEAGASVVSLAWDLDANGSFETAGSPVTFEYVSNGTHTAALRVTDSNGLTATDTISVVVWDAVTNIASVSPPSAAPATTVPAVIHGTNFKGVTLPTQVTVSGTGVTVTGAPVVNHLGTQISGLSFVVASNATVGPRNVSVTNSDGAGAAGTGTSAFTVGTPTSGACCTGTVCAITTQSGCSASGGVWQGLGSACGPVGNPTTCCRANFDGVGGTAVPDIFAFLSAWFAGQAAANFDGVGGIGVPDIFAFLSAWYAGC